MVQRIYISGPISGFDINERRATFMAVQRKLESAGLSGVNPMENGLPSSASYEEHMQFDLSLLSVCDGVYMMPAWIFSRGCRREYRLARRLSIPIYYDIDDIPNI